MLWPTLAVIAFVLLGMTGAACGWLVADRRTLRAKRDELQSSLDQAGEQNGSLQRELHDLQREIAVARESQRHLEKHLEQANRQLRDSFQALAGDALKQSTEQFLQMARRAFEGEKKDVAHQLEQRQQAIASLIQPIKDTLAKYNESLQGIESARKEAYGSLTKQLELVATDQRRLRQETASLVSALRRPEGRGRWGEMQLKRVAEIAGMIENCDFYEQGSLDTADGRLRPDMVVKLPGERTIVVDAKTPCDAFISAVQADGDDEREKFLKQHVSQIETQVGNLAKKQYYAQFDRTPDFVVMFIPGESFLQAAVQRKPDLLESAMVRGVVIATPTTLVTLLKAVAVGWREQRIAENARRISELGQELHERIAVATGHLDTVGTHLGKAINAYNTLVGSFESRVLVTARKFKEVGADSAKELPAEGQVKPIETVPRELRERSV